MPNSLLSRDSPGYGTPPFTCSLSEFQRLVPTMALAHRPAPIPFGLSGAPCPAEYPLTYPKHRPKIPLGYLIFPSPKATPTNRDPCLPIRPLTYSHPIYLWDNLLYCLGPNHYSEGVYSFNCLKSGMTYYTLIVGQNFLNNLRGCVII